MSKFARQVEVIYCDDIRQELGSKFSYMGVYGADLVLQSFPVTLPKLCLAVKVITGVDDPFDELEVLVLQGDDEEEILGTGQIPLPTQESFAENSSKVIVVQTFLMLSPFQIDKETILRVKAKTGAEVLKGLALRIKAENGGIA